MSPTTRWSRNRTPLTTWPSRTSRQGIMRRARMASELLGGDAFLEQRLAADRGRGADGGAARQVGGIAHAARCLPLDRGKRRTPRRRARGSGPQRAVARDVGAQHVHERRAAGSPPRRPTGQASVCAGPSRGSCTRGVPASSRTSKASTDAFRAELRASRAPRRVPHGDAADHDASTPLREQRRRQRRGERMPPPTCSVTAKAAGQRRHGRRGCPGCRRARRRGRRCAASARRAR
jgi:hypothetical protein